MACLPMLNELFALEQGLVAAGFEVAPRHPDLSSPGRTDALQLRLNVQGRPVEAAVLGRDRVAALWTLRSGKHNSFPYVQLKQPLLSIPSENDWRKVHVETWKPLTPEGRRQFLRRIAHDHPVSAEATAALVSKGLHDSLRKRQGALAGLEEPHASVPAVIERVLAIGSGAEFADALLALLLGVLDEADDTLLEAIRTVLAGRVVQGGVVGSPLLMDVENGQFERDVADSRHAAAISVALSGGAARGSQGTCLLTGTAATLHAGNFPQPTVPVLGQIYPFSKNGDIPAAFRYGCADVTALPISANLVQRLAGALDAITKPERKGQTWLGVPGETPSVRDLLIAYVDGAPDAPMAELFAADDTEDTADDDGSAEETGHLNDDDRRAVVASAARARFQVRTGRVIQTVEGKVRPNFQDTPVSVLVLRKVDTGNAKAILHRALTVGRLHDAAAAWAHALDNLPHWLHMPVPPRGKGKTPRQRRPPALAPLLLPRTTQALFTRGGSERAKREPVGITAADALTLFLGETGSDRVAQAALRIVLARQGTLLSGSAQALRRDAGSGELKAARAFDRGAALQAATLVGVLLAKTGRKKDTYMTEPAFQLGQLLAAADAIHVGYCMDMRGGQVPPTLLGNSVLTLAQADPQRALATLCRRWKPYSAWVRSRADYDEAKRLSASKNAQESAKGWAIRAAISQDYRMKDVAFELGHSLPDTRDADDRYRAELLLGYVAGLPRKSDSEARERGEDA